MKTIRYLAAFLLVLTGVLHFLPEIKAPEDPNALPMLAFGIVFLIIGILLFVKYKYGPLLGLIFSLIGLATGFIVVSL